MALGRAVQLPGFVAIVLHVMHDVVAADAGSVNVTTLAASGTDNDPTKISTNLIVRWSFMGFPSFWKISLIFLRVCAPQGLRSTFAIIAIIIRAFCESIRKARRQILCVAWMQTETCSARWR